MANCRYCGKWAGIVGDEHMDCALMAANGKTVEEIRETVDAPSQRLPLPPLTAAGVFWSVFGALWAFGITAGIVAAILRAILS